MQLYSHGQCFVHSDFLYQLTPKDGLGNLFIHIWDIHTASRVGEIKLGKLPHGSRIVTGSFFVHQSQDRAIFLTVTSKNIKTLEVRWQGC